MTLKRVNFDTFLITLGNLIYLCSCNFIGKRIGCILGEDVKRVNASP